MSGGNPQFIYICNFFFQNVIQLFPSDASTQIFLLFFFFLNFYFYSHGSSVSCSPVVISSISEICAPTLRPAGLAANNFKPVRVIHSDSSGSRRRTTHPCVGRQSDLTNVSLPQKCLTSVSPLQSLAKGLLLSSFIQPPTILSAIIFQ